MKRYKRASIILIVALVVLTACNAGQVRVTPSAAPTETPLPPSQVRVSTLPPPASDTPVPATNTPIPPPTSPVASATPGCTLQASFVADVTIPDGSAVTPNGQFVKTWRVKNSGTCDWGKGLSLVFVEGNQLGGPSALTLSPADAGQSLDIAINLKAPADTGAYRGKWQLRAPNGAVLTGLTVSIVIAATPTPAPTGPPTATPKPTPVPTFEAGIESFVGLWTVVEEKFGGNVTDTQRLQQLQINKSGTQLRVSPATTFDSPYGFGLVGFVPANYSGGPSIQWEFDDPSRGHVSISMKINKLCNASVRLSYAGFNGGFIVQQPNCVLPGQEP